MFERKLIFRIGSIPRHLVVVLKSLLGIRFFDPIEVYYLVEEKQVFPISSKCGNSSLKLFLIRKFIPDYYLGFPFIHSVDPAGVCDGRLLRLYFYNFDDYRRFCYGKKVTLIMRDPADRLISAYRDLKSQRNRWYMYPAKLYNVFNVKHTITLRAFIRFIRLVPDQIADKHFRSQSFYFQPCIPEVAREVEVLEMKDFFRHNVRGEQKQLHLNKSESTVDAENIKKEINRYVLETRYARDYVLFDTIKSSR